MKVVVDTSIIIDNLRGGPNWERFIKYKISEVELFIPTVVIIELYSGTSTRDPQKLKNDSNVGVFSKNCINRRDCKRAGEIFRDEKTSVYGRLYYRATAIEIGAEVATLNTKHFKKIPGVRIYDFSE